MREHMGLFRGKRLVDGKWVQGVFCPKEFIPLRRAVDHAQIIRLVEPCDGIWFDVDPDTVGECTGLTDKNGKLIFEGDIFRSNDGWIVETGSVFYDEGGWCVNNNFLQAFMWGGEVRGAIIGNIHDNPELMKGGEADE